MTPPTPLTPAEQKALWGQKVIEEINKLHIHHEQAPEPFNEKGRPNEKQFLVLAKACADRDMAEAEAAAHSDPDSDTLVKAAKEAADAYDNASTTYTGYIAANLAANDAMQTCLTVVFDGIHGQVSIMAGFQGFIVTQFVTFESTDDMTGGCSARADVPITACVHGELNDKVRTPEIQNGIFFIYFALALNLFILTCGQLAVSEINRTKWLSKGSYKDLDRIAAVLAQLQLCSSALFYASMCYFLRGVEGIGNYHIVGSWVYGVVGTASVASAIFSFTKRYPNTSNLLNLIKKKIHCADAFRCLAQDPENELWDDLVDPAVRADHGDAGNGDLAARTGSYTDANPSSAAAAGSPA